MNWLDWLLIALIILAVSAAVSWMIKQHRRGRCIGCGGDCANCPWANRLNQKEASSKTKE